jgi:hypothetical protein
MFVTSGYPGTDHFANLSLLCSESPSSVLWHRRLYQYFGVEYYPHIQGYNNIFQSRRRIPVFCQRNLPRFLGFWYGTVLESGRWVPIFRRSILLPSSGLWYGTLLQPGRLVPMFQRKIPSPCSGLWYGRWIPMLGGKYCPHNIQTEGCIKIYTLQ